MKGEARVPVIDFPDIVLEYWSAEDYSEDTPPAERSIDMNVGDDLIGVTFYAHELAALRDAITDVLVELEAEEPAPKPSKIGKVYVDVEVSEQSKDRIRMIVAEMVQQLAEDASYWAGTLAERNALGHLAGAATRYQED